MSRDFSRSFLKFVMGRYRFTVVFALLLPGLCTGGPGHDSTVRGVRDEEMLGTTTPRLQTNGNWTVHLQRDKIKNATTKMSADLEVSALLSTVSSSPRNETTKRLTTNTLEGLFPPTFFDDYSSSHGKGVSEASGVPLTIMFQHEENEDLMNKNSDNITSKGKVPVPLRKGSRLLLPKPQKTVAARSIQKEEARHSLRKSEIKERGLRSSSKKTFSKRGHNIFSHAITYDVKGRNGVRYLANQDNAPVQFSYSYIPSDKEYISRAMGDANHYNYSPIRDKAVAYEIAGIPRKKPNVEGDKLVSDYQRFGHEYSCRQYLEFLRYAFEQIDNYRNRQADDRMEYPDDYYDFDEDEYQMEMNQAPIYPPLVITPNQTLIRTLSYDPKQEDSKAHELENEGIGNRALDSAVKISRTLQSTLPPIIHDLPGEGEKVPLGPILRKTTIEQEISEIYDVTPTTEVSKEESSILRHEPLVDEVTVITRPLTISKGRAKITKIIASNNDSDCHDKMYPCPDNINVTFPVNGYCNRFVVCESGKPHPESCEEGLHFNLVSRQCDLPHKSFCTYSCPSAFGYFGIPGDCGGFFRCSNWYPEYRMCPPRMHWDFKAKICTFEELSSCPLKCDVPNQVKPYNGVCDSYVICTRSVATYHRCPDGTHFDHKQLKCISESMSTCANDVDYIVKNAHLSKACSDVGQKDGIGLLCMTRSASDV